MKKIFSVMAIALLATGLFAKTWTNNVGVGLAFPINKFEYDYENEAKQSVTFRQTQISYDAQGLYLGYHENGFTVRGSFDLGIGTIKDMWGDENGIGVNLKEQIGVGYSFIRSEKFVLALTGGLGLQETIFPREDKVVYGTDSYTRDRTVTSLMLNIGADLTALVRFSEKFGMFFNMHAGFVPFGKIYLEEKREGSSKSSSSSITVNTDYDLKKTYTITPSVGVVWTF